MQPDHTHTWYGWLNHHWAFLSLVCFPAGMGYLNGLAAFFRVMGNTQLSDWLSKFEEAIKAFIANAKPQNQPPAPPSQPTQGATT